MEALEQASDTLLAIMQLEIVKTVHGDGPGKPDWRDELAEELTEVYRIVTQEAIEVGVGLPNMTYASAGYKFIRAMLIAYGGGSAAGGKAMHTRPGQLVWDDDLLDYAPSQAVTTYDLPAAFNQPGNDFMANAMRIMKTHFVDVLDSAVTKLPTDLFSRHVHTTKR